MDSREFEIFSGTGGVGKTTLATSRAISLARNGKSVLLITIDPARRLRDLLNISDEQAGEVVHTNDPLDLDENLSLYTELMNPSKTFNRLVKIAGEDALSQNRILKVLTRPYGGLNEILAIVELNIQYQTKKYDVIVLDTPPGEHFLDFLDSTQRIKVFFDKSFIDIFNYLGKKVDPKSLPLGKGLFNKIVSSGVKKLLGYLNRVTGDKFVQDFIDTIIGIYSVKTPFLDALNLQEKLKSHDYSNWYLVTSVEQKKLSEALELKNSASGLITDETFVILNKCLSDDIPNWSPSNQEHIQLKSSLVKKQNELKRTLNTHFKHILEFPEIISLSPLDHIDKLSKTWEKF